MMRSGKLSVGLAAVAIVALGVLGMATRAAAQTETVLYSFLGGNDGWAPLGNLASDAAGNLYGTTEEGGAFSDGDVFELTPNSSGGWTETVLYTFTGGNDGRYPTGGVILDSAGNLYGTTARAGQNGDGTVFELSPASEGGWTFATIHTFTGPDGANSYAGLAFDAAGNLYGTTLYGGSHGLGAVFEMKPTPLGTWNESVIHSFTGGADQGEPVAAVAFDSAGNLYGTNNGVYGYGIVFKLTHQAGGGWKIDVLEAFYVTGAYPNGKLVVDSMGNLYGTTYQGGGGSGYGTVFELQPTSGSRWKFSTLWTFDGGTDGGNPESGLVRDPAGNLYGITPGGGQYGYGVVFKLRPAGSEWLEDVIYSFTGGVDGARPSVLMSAPAGNFYGTTFEGGSNGGGTVFEIKP